MTWRMAEARAAVVQEARTVAPNVSTKQSQAAATTSTTVNRETSVLAQDPPRQQLARSKAA